MRVERKIPSVEVWSAIVGALAPDIAAAAHFYGEEAEDGFHVTMEPQASGPVDAILADLPGLHIRSLLAYAADKRWRHEVGGITIGGVPIATDDRSKIMIMGARVAAAADAGWTTVWHGADGQTYPLNAAQMIAISNAVEAHVNGTFATFAIIRASIESGDITITAEIDAVFA